MKILALSDQIVEDIYSPQIKEKYGDVSLVIGCGDLPYYYLEYVATMLPVPVVYVHGNHDREAHMADGRTVTTPEGCTSLEDRVVSIAGLTMAGLGGSMRYSQDARFQYSEWDMGARVLDLAPRLLMSRLTAGHGLDLLVTHSPPLGIHDGQDLPHRGFKSFLTLMRLARPTIMLHGHTHLYKQTPHITSYYQTQVVNVYPCRVIEIAAHARD